MFVRTRADDVRDELGELAAHMNAANARMIDLLAELDDLDGWGGVGIRSIGHWASLALGLHPRRTNELMTCARSLAELPSIREALAAGELSVDKVQAIARVATPETAAQWLHVARTASTAQVCRVASKFAGVARQREHEADAPSDGRRRRGVYWHDDPDGMVRLLAILDPDEAAIVRAAIDAAMEQEWRDGNGQDSPVPVRAADALVAIAETALAVGPRPLDGGDRTQVILHVDAELLAGTRRDGRCHLEHGGSIGVQTARRLACDAIIVPLLERDGSPVDVGRARRVVNRAQRRALFARDGGCTFPGCGATRFLDAHHIDHWIDGGRTDLINLVLLCRHHHRLHHEGGYRIERGADGELRFLARDGSDVVPAVRIPRCQPTELRRRQELAGFRPTWLTAHAKDPLSGATDAIVDGLLQRLRPPPESA